MVVVQTVSEINRFNKQISVEEINNWLDVQKFNPMQTTYRNLNTE